MTLCVGYGGYPQPGYGQQGYYQGNVMAPPQQVMYGQPGLQQQSACDGM